MLKIRYYDRDKKKSVELDLPADVVAINIPETDEQPALVVNVNTDAVIVDTASGKRVQMHEFSDMLAEADD